VYPSPSWAANENAQLLARTSSESETHYNIVTDVVAKGRSMRSGGQGQLESGGFADFRLALAEKCHSRTFKIGRQDPGETRSDRGAEDDRPLWPSLDVERPCRPLQRSDLAGQETPVRVEPLSAYPRTAGDRPNFAAPRTKDAARSKMGLSPSPRRFSDRLLKLLCRQSPRRLAPASEAGLRLEA
jgi:hypothetical protein